YRYLAHLTGDRDLAEDLASATFERALRAWARFDPSRGEPRVWLLQIARRLALDHFRGDGPRPVREAPYAGAHGEAPPGPARPRGRAWAAARPAAPRRPRAAHPRRARGARAAGRARPGRAGGRGAHGRLGVRGRDPAPPRPRQAQGRGRP